MGEASAGGYRVHPDGVSAVLTAVAAAGEALDTVLKPLPAGVAAGGSAADGLDSGMVCTVGVPSAGLISAALQALMEVVGTDLDLIETRVPAAVAGLHDATQAVIDGDAAMATRVQGLMMQAIEPAQALGRRAGSP